MATRWTSKHTGQKIDDTIDGVCNPNLLDNWYFGNPVNQRGQTEYAANAYGIDRWRLTNNYTKMEIVSDGVLFSADGGTAYCIHYLDIDISGKTLTLSALVGGEVKSVTEAAQVGMTTASVQIADGCRMFLEYKSTNSRFDVGFSVQDGKSITVRAVKLELGSQQTLAHKDAGGNWVLNEIPDYGEQLARCQRYFVSVRGGITGLYANFAFGYASSNNFAYVTCSIPVAMRTTPAISSKGSFRLSVNGGKSSLAVTAIESSANSTAALIRLGVRVASGATQGDIVMLQADNDNTADIYLSADL